MTRYPKSRIGSWTTNRVTLCGCPRHIRTLSLFPCMARDAFSIPPSLRAYCTPWKAAAIRVLRPFSSFGAVVSALVISCCVFAIILVAKRSNGCRIFCAALFGLIGGCVATPAISNPGCGPAEAGAYGVVGIIVGWLIGCGVARLDEHFTFRRDERVSAGDQNQPSMST